MSEVIKRVFSSEIQKHLFPNNEFYKDSKVDAGVAIDKKTVELPQAAGKTTGGKNPATLPLTIEEAAENDKKTYDVDLYYTKPIFVTDEKQAIVSYDKRKELLEEHYDFLNTMYAHDTAQKWAATNAANVIRTTGELAPSLLTGATGDRKMPTREDWVNADRIMTNMGVPEANRKALVSGNMYSFLLNAGFKDFIGSDKLSSDLIAEGVVAMFLGFKIFKRSAGLVYTAGATQARVTPMFDADGAKVFGDNIQATDNEGILFWHPNFVRRAEGTVKVYHKIDAPEYLGSVFNAAFRGGATKSRNDEKGIVALVQQA